MNNQKNIENSYDIILKKREALIEIIDKQIQILSSLNIETWVETLLQLKNRVSSDVFKVLIVGEFKRGKSTFINALLGEEILPAYSTPCTAIINEVKWSESPEAKLHFLKSEDGSTLKPKIIPIDKIEEYVVINDEETENSNFCYEKAEIFYPLELCRRGVEIIDSPGLNEHVTRSQVTENYLPIVDAIIFVFTCEALASQSEIRFIENSLRARGHKDLFFVCNRFDQIRNKEKERVKNFAYSKLAPLTQKGEKGIFLISALEALEGRLDDDQERVARSNVPTLEQELESFLANEKGKSKITEPAKEIYRSFNFAKKVIPERKGLLNVSFQDLEKRYREAQGQFKSLELRKEQIEQKITYFLDDVGIRVGRDAIALYETFPKKVNTWVHEYEIESQLDVLDSLKSSPLNYEEFIQHLIKPITDEISECICKNIEDEFTIFQQEKLNPFLITRLDTLKQDIDARANEFIREADSLRNTLCSGSSSYASEAAKEFIETSFKTESLFRLKTGDKGVFRFVKRMFIVFYPAAFIGSLIAKNRLKAKIIKDVKERSVLEFSNTIKNTLDTEPFKIPDQVLSNLGVIKDNVSQGLDKEIRSIKEQVESVLKNKLEGQSSVNDNLRELEIIFAQINYLEGQLNDLINQLSLI